MTELEEWHRGYDLAIEMGMDESEAVQIADGGEVGGWRYFGRKGTTGRKFDRGTNF